MTTEVRTTMYSVVNGRVVVHKFPFNAKEPMGMEKLQKFVDRGFTFDDPRLKAPPVQTVALAPVIETPVEAPVKKWANMNATERKAYQEAKKIG